MYSNKRKKFITVDEMNQHLKYVQQYYILHQGKKPDNTLFKRNAYYEDNQIQFKLTYRKGSYACTYICRKDNEEVKQQIEGLESYRILCKYAKIDKLNEDKYWQKQLGYDEKDRVFKQPCVKPLLYSNPEYEGRRVIAKSYDMNSAYSNAMLQTMPDTSKKPLYHKRLEKGEIGFKYDKDNCLKCVTEVGKLCYYVFKEIESPYKRFVEHWYNVKKTSTGRDREKAKEILNYCVGYLQKINPFIRCRIVTYCNDLIQSLMDENTIYSNTDCIVSRVERNDLNIGENIGQFKVEKFGFFALKGKNYQWNKEYPTYRGVAKKWFNKDYDILTDEIPVEKNKYYFDKEILQLCEKHEKWESLKR